MSDTPMSDTPIHTEEHGEKTLPGRILKEMVGLALDEDRVNEDVTTLSLLEFDRDVTAAVTAKADGIISGTGVFLLVFETVDPGVTVTAIKGDGQPVKKGDTVLEIHGKESSILKAERTALNFMQRLSGIATLTRAFVEKINDSGNTGVKLLDTRKTTPGMRYMEKKAVKDGGGTNHRMNLEDMAMVKDNHIEMAGSITGAVQAIRKKFPGKKIEVEVKNPDELSEALDQGADIIMLDNFSPELLEKAVNQTRNHQNHNIKLEISGNVTLDTISDKAKTGVDFISVGALTHSFKSLDLSLNITGLRD